MASAAVRFLASAQSPLRFRWIVILAVVARRRATVLTAALCCRSPIAAA